MTADSRIAAGMRAQLAAREADLAAGARSLGWKIGLNLSAVQRHLGIDAPVVGYLTTATQLSAGDPVHVGEMGNPRLEPEIAIWLSADLPEAVDAPAAAQAIAGLGPALELVDIHPSAELEAILAGNVFHRGVLLGPREPGLDAASAVEVRTGGSEPLHAEVADDPAEIVSFVSTFLAEHGAHLSAGECIIGGSLTPQIRVEPGLRVEADFGALGSLRVGVEA